MEFSTAASISVKKNLKGTHLWARCPLWTSVTQVVPVSVVATQLLLRVLEISKLPSSVLERAGGCLGCFQSGSLKHFEASSGLSGGVTYNGFRGGRMQFRSRAQLSNLSMK